MDDFTKLIENAKKQLNWYSLTAFQRNETLLHVHQCSARLENGQICPCDCLCTTRDQLKGSEPLVLPASAGNGAIKCEQPSTVSSVISLQVESSDPLPSSSWHSDTANILPTRTVRHNDDNLTTNMEKMKQQKCLKCYHVAEDHFKLIKNVHDQDELLISFLFLKDIKLLKAYEAAEQVPSVAKRVFVNLKHILERMINNNNSQVYITIPVSLSGHYQNPPFETPSIEYLLFNMISRHNCEFSPLSDAFRIVRRVITFLNKLELPRPESVYTQAMTFAEKRLYESFYEHWLIYCHLPKVTSTLKSHRLTTIFGVRFLILLWDAILQFFVKTVIVEGERAIVPVMSATACDVSSANYCRFFDVIVDSLFFDILDATRQNHIEPAYLKMIKGSIISSNSPLSTSEDGSLKADFAQQGLHFVPTFSAANSNSFCHLQIAFKRLIQEKEEGVTSESSCGSSQLSSLSEASNVIFRNEENSGAQGAVTATKPQVNGNVNSVAASVHAGIQQAEPSSLSMRNFPPNPRHSENVFRKLIFDAIDSVNDEDIGGGRNIGSHGNDNDNGGPGSRDHQLSSLTMMATHGIEAIAGRLESPLLLPAVTKPSVGTAIPMLPVFGHRSKIGEPHRCLTQTVLQQHMLEQQTAASSYCPSPSQSTSTNMSSMSTTTTISQSIGQLAADTADQVNAISDKLVRQARKVSQQISSSLKGLQLDQSNHFLMNSMNLQTKAPLHNNSTVVITVSSSEVAFSESEDELIVQESKYKNVVSFSSLSSPTLCYCHFSQIMELVIEAKMLVNKLESHLLKPLLAPGGFAAYVKKQPRSSAQVPDQENQSSSAESGSDTENQAFSDQPSPPPLLEPPRASFHLSTLQRYPVISYVLGLRPAANKHSPNVPIDHPNGYNALVEAKGFMTFLVHRILAYLQLVVSHCEDMNLEVVEDLADFVFFDSPFQPFMSEPSDVAIKNLFYDTLSRRCNAIIRRMMKCAQPAVDDEPRLSSKMPQYRMLSITGSNEGETGEDSDEPVITTVVQKSPKLAPAVPSSSGAAMAVSEKPTTFSPAHRGRPKKRPLESGNTSSTNSPSLTKSKRETPTKAKSDLSDSKRYQRKQGRRSQSPKKLKTSESNNDKKEKEADDSSSFSSLFDDAQTEIDRISNGNSTTTTGTSSGSEQSKTPPKRHRKRSLPASGKTSSSIGVPKKRRRRKKGYARVTRRKTKTTTTAVSLTSSLSLRKLRQTVSISHSSFEAGPSGTSASTAFISERSSSSDGSSSSSSSDDDDDDESSLDSDCSIGYGRTQRRSARLRNAALMAERRRRFFLEDDEEFNSDDDDSTSEEEDLFEEEEDDSCPPKRKPWDYLEGVTACFIHRDHFPLVMAPNSSRRDPKPWFTFGMGKSIRSEYVKRKQLMFMEVQEIVRVCLPNMLPEFVNQYMFAEGTKTLLMMKQKRVFCCTVFKAHPERGFCEIVYCTTQRQMQGKGFGRAMLNIIKRYCLDRAIPKLLVMGDKDNHQFFLKCNFSGKITVPQELYEGELCDCTDAVLLECIIERVEELPEYPMLFDNELARLDDPTEKEMTEAAERAVAQLDISSTSSRRAAARMKRQALKQELLRRRAQFQDLPPVSDEDWKAMRVFLKKFRREANAEGRDRLMIFTEDFQEAINLADRIYDRFRCVPTWEVVLRRHKSKHYRSIGMLYYDMVMMMRAIMFTVKGKRQRAKTKSVFELEEIFNKLIQEHFPALVDWQM